MWMLQGSNEESPPVEWNHRVPVPALIDCADPPYEWGNLAYHYYATRFQAPDESQNALLIIEQAMFGTDVWLNGKYIGSDIACYTSQEHDVHNHMLWESMN